MNVERRVKISAAVTACMGTFILGIGEGNHLLAAMAIVVSFGSLVVCDLYGWFRLNNLGSNVASCVILIVTLRRLIVGAPEEHVLVMADLMGFLQFVLQFKRKTIRNYWLLGLVSFLQTAVASALHSGVGFLFLLTVYLFSSLFFLTYFYLFREQQRFSELARRREAAVRSSTQGFFARPRVFAPEGAASQEISRRVTGVALGTIAVTAVFFAIIPRIDDNRWTTPGIVETRTVGFSQEINLNNGGTLVDDPDEVMQVQFLERDTGRPYAIVGEIYLRGGSAMSYDRGRWSPGFVGRSGPGNRRVPPYQGYDARHSDAVLQSIRIEPSSNPTVFTCLPITASAESSDIVNKKLVLHEGYGQLSRTDQTRTNEALKYELLTTAFRNQRQTTLIPAAFDAARLRELLQLPEQRLPELRRAAEAVTARIPAAQVYQQAKALEAYLRDSGEFAYARDSDAHPAGVDPLEDFVANRKQGHCEYFAGALALMLRSRGIPARVVLGYHDGEFNVVGSFYRFQQLHAHSWVEAYLAPDQIPGELVAAGVRAADQYPQGAWLQLDATPSASNNAATITDSTWQQLQQVFDYVRFLWANYVVGMDSTRQQESIYRPLQDAIARWWRLLSDPQTWSQWWHTTLRRLDPMNWNIELLSWRGGIIVLALIGGFWAAVLGIVAIRRSRRRRRATSQVRRRDAATEVEFYARLEKLLNRLQLRRAPDQTQREFALAAGGELAETATTRSAASLPKKIVDAFYRVRFGRRPLDNGEQLAVEQALASLDESLARPRTAPH